jgi:phosphohistidine phosphatase SixA
MRVAMALLVAVAAGLAAAQAPAPAQPSAPAPTAGQFPVPASDVDAHWHASLAGKALGDALRHGGYTLFFRHTASDFAQQDQHLDGHGPCSEQRNLTDAGRAAARTLGADIAKARIPIGEVLASPFCRTRESAQLMFRRVQVTDAVRGGPPELGPEVNKALAAILATPPARGTNRVIVGHTNAFFTLSRLAHLDDGECAVFQAQLNGPAVVVARIKPGDWPLLGR